MYSSLYATFILSPHDCIKIGDLGGVAMKMDTWMKVCHAEAQLGVDGEASACCQHDQRRWLQQKMSEVPYNPNMLPSNMYTCMAGATSAT